jgi:hypothetical protein
MDRFVEKVGPNIILLRPNFFLYLNEQEQAAAIAVQLQRIKDNHNPELSQHHRDIFLKNFKIVSGIVAAAAFYACYYKDCNALACA